MTTGRGRVSTTPARGRGRGRSPSAHAGRGGATSYNAVPPPPNLNTPPQSASSSQQPDRLHCPPARPATPPSSSGSTGGRGSNGFGRRPNWSGLGSAERCPPSWQQARPGTPSGSSSVPPRPAERPGASGRPGSGKHMTRSPGAWAAGAQGTAGEGARRVCISQDREPGIWKVGPPPGARFSTGFLEGVTAWAAAKQAEQQQQPAATSPAAAAEAAAGAGTPSVGSLTDAFAAVTVQQPVSAQPQPPQQLPQQRQPSSGEASDSSAAAGSTVDRLSDGAVPSDVAVLDSGDGCSEGAITGDLPEELQDDAASSPLPSAPAAVREPVQVSLRLECMQLTDAEAGLLAAWAARNSDLISVRKLWLYENRLGDEGAAALAPLLASSRLLEVHLSHNLIGGAGAAALLAQVPAPSRAAQPGKKASFGPGGPGRGLWLRLEWNQIPVDGLTAMLGEEKHRRGLLSDIPVKRAMASRGHEQTLRFAGGPAHLCLPWAWCQRLAPAAAPLLREARAAWAAKPDAAAVGSQPAPPPPPRVYGAAAVVASAGREGGPAAAPPKSQQQQQTGGAVGGQQAAQGAGPLLLFPDTSALLAMLGCRAGPASSHCPLTMRDLEELAAAGRFGRGLPAAEQAFLVLTDSVAKQLDGLKNDGAVSAAIRRFLGKGLDTCGPAGLDFLTVLGAHEGEGLVVAADAEVAGSRSPWLADNGQRVDAKIVEVALFFQNELAAAAAGGPAGGASGGGVDQPAMSVVLLSGDNAQLSLARSHGLPAAKMSDLAGLPAAMSGMRPLSASLLRGVLQPAATKGLGTKAGRSVQRQFDEAVACLRALHAELAATQAAAAAAAAAAGDASLDPAAALTAVSRALRPGALDTSSHVTAVAAAAAAPGSQDAAPTAAAAAAEGADAGTPGAAAVADAVPGGGVPAAEECAWGGLAAGRRLAAAVAAQLEQWEAVVGSHQSASRVLRWTASDSGAGA